MDNEKKESAALDEAALEAVSGGNRTVGEDGSVTYDCIGLLPDGSLCGAPLVFPPVIGVNEVTCSRCGWTFRQFGGTIRVVRASPVNRG